MAVPDSYAHGDPSNAELGIKHNGPGETLRLVSGRGPCARLSPKRPLIEVEANPARVAASARCHGIGIGVLYAIVQIGVNGTPISRELGWQSLGIAVLVGLGLELANHLFLAKRQRIQRLSADLQEAREAGRHLQKVIREAGRL